MLAEYFHGYYDDNESFLFPNHFVTNDTKTK